MTSHSDKNKLNLNQSIEFIFGNKSIFTIVSKKTKKRYTFKVNSPKRQNDLNNKVYFVSYLNGSDNRTSYQFLGTIFSGEDLRYFHSKKSKNGESSVVNKTFTWLFNTLINGNEDNFEKIEFWHEGKCGKCSRKLTDPVSIERGFGSHCVKKTESERKKEFREKRLSFILSKKIKITS